MPALKFDWNKLLLSALVFFMISVVLPGRANSEIQLSDGETVYISVYSNIYSGPKKYQFDLAAMINIRNTDSKYPITIIKADYYDNHGKLLDRYVEERFELGPLASTHFYIKEYDRRGGPGANFIVKWQSKKEINQPIIEGLMIGLASGQGVSFTCPGQIIKEHDD